jgi:hypothetical protein
MTRLSFASFVCATEIPLRYLIVPSLRDGSVFSYPQAVNCLATIIRSLRDKNLRQR